MSKRYLRASLFFCCRKYLLNSLYNDLQHLSADTIDTSPSIASSSSDIMLNVLPPPATATSTRASRSFSALSVKAVKPSRAPQNQALRVQSSIARTAFALCFEEGCILFLLVMSQALGLFDFRWGSFLCENRRFTLVLRTRLLNWRISLAILVTSIVLFIPLVQCLLFTYRWSSPKGSVWNSCRKPSLTTDDENSDARNRTSLTSRAAFTAIPFSLYLVAFSQIPLPSHLDTSSKRSIYLYHSIVTN